MYARIATFDGVDAAASDAMSAQMDDRYTPQIRALDGFAGFLALLDRGASRALSLVLFDSEEALRSGDQALDAMSPPAEAGAMRRTAVETYEVVMHEFRGEVEAARLSRFQGSPDRLDEGIEAGRQQVLPRAQQMDGWQGHIYAVDRSSGAVVLFTLWESRDALQASESKADELRRESADLGSETITGVERYEVVYQDVPAGSRV